MNKSNNPLNRIIFSWPMFILLLFIFFLLARGVFFMNQKRIQAKESLYLVESEVNDLESKKEILVEKKANLGTAYGEEEELRSRFRIVKPGEELIVIVPE